MDIPAPFQSVFDRWTTLGIHVVHAHWTTPLMRHVGVEIQCERHRYFAKLALIHEKDLDEPDRLGGMQREVWWSRLINTLCKTDAAFPFSAPNVISTNVSDPLTEKDEVAWTMFEFIDGGPIVDWDLGDKKRTPLDGDSARLDRFLDAVTVCLLALENIHPNMPENLGLPDLPAVPHGMRRWRKKGLLNIKTAILGNGAFEVENFWQTRGGRVVIMDNEFAGWYPKHDSLSYLYHRLACNSRRPDLARSMLRQYLQASLETGSFSTVPDFPKEFWRPFTQILVPRLLSGWYNDTSRRHLMPWHQNQQQRYKLLWSILTTGETDKFTY